MPQKTLVYYFTMTSPWAYIGHAVVTELAAKHGLKLDYRPIGLGQIFPETGGVPLAKRAPARQAYRLVELQRWREKRGVHVNLHPKFFPFDVALMDRVVLALLQSGKDAAAFIPRGFRAIWSEDRNMADRAEVAKLLQEAGLNADTVLKLADSPEIVAAYQANIAQALAAGVFGSPSYVLDGELFWGQDRLELLAEMLQSGRAAYHP